MTLFSTHKSVHCSAIIGESSPYTTWKLTQRLTLVIHIGNNGYRVRTLEPLALNEMTLLNSSFQGSNPYVEKEEERV